uniref:Transforming growth factor-beta receptor type 3-like protein isoform X1 n=1 Tax=Geotrypetes seraphini TaxID=260995 RepID=A0A6P8NWQ8_GEOSA|nr:transforming growth factor-beta receptor type 3-like protein isoform X1 [Geotrypetes seraphini]XP_033780872.1 transforming growth factor-beta receptor type 3-like protein isoform X1 [Geotrypetes seraphini]
MSDSFPPVVHQFSPSLNWLKQVARPQSAPQDNAVGWLEEGWSESHGLLASTGSWEEPAGGSSPEKVMSVSCLEKKMLVQVRKDVLEPLGYSTALVTLQDPQCRAESNGSHFLLESPLTSCGTLVGTDEDSTPGALLYRNAVLLRRDPGLSISSNGSETSLATGEQTEQIMQRFEFTCMYVAQPSPLRTPPAFNRALVRLKAYTSDSFLQQCRPCIVPTNSWVFVEAVLQQSNPQISFSIQLCRISPSSDPMVESNFIVVRDTCPVDPSVTFFRNQLMEDHQVQEVQRFAFQLRPAYNESIQFLHCQLALCFKEGLGTLKRPWDAPKCLPQDSACTGSAGGIEPVNGSFLRIISKPMIVTMGGVMESVSRVQDSSLITGRKTKHLQEPAKLDLDRTHAASQQEVDMGAVVGIAVSAFIIGAFLISGLWFIYCQTDPRRTFRLAPLLPLTVEKPQKDSSDTGSPQTEILRGTLNSL